jgi:hypothetical protein
MASPTSDDTLTRALAETVAMRAIAEILSELPDDGSRIRVLRWCEDHFSSTPRRHVSSSTHDDHRAGGTPVEDDDHTLTIGTDVFDMLPPKPEPIHCDATELEEFVEPDEFGPLASDAAELDDVMQPEKSLPQKPRGGAISLGLDTLLRDFVCDFQRLALEFQRA